MRSRQHHFSVTVLFGRSRIFNRDVFVAPFSIGQSRQTAKAIGGQKGLLMNSGTTLDNLVPFTAELAETGTYATGETQAGATLSTACELYEGGSGI